MPSDPKIVRCPVCNRRFHATTLPPHTKPTTSGTTVWACEGRRGEAIELK